MWCRWGPMTDIDWNNAIEAAAVVADDYGRRAWAAQPAAQQAAVAAGGNCGGVRKVKGAVRGATPPLAGGARGGGPGPPKGKTATSGVPRAPRPPRGPPRTAA